MHEAADFQPADLERQRAFLQRLARQLVRGEAEAEDLVQDTFLRAPEQPPASATALPAWLARVARHLAINRGRSEQRSRARERRVARSEGLPSHDEALAGLELQERLIAAVKSLAEPYRTTLWLRFHEGLAPGAIAERQATTKKTIESRLTRGLALLRAELDRQAGGDRTQWFGGALLLARGPSSPWISTLVGVGIMKKLAVAVALLVVFGLAWRFGAGPSVRSVPEPATSASLDGAPAVSATTELRDEPRTALETTTPARAPREPRAGLRIRLRWSDGAPAPGVGLFVHPEDDPRGVRAVQRLRSDAEGLARAEAVHPGAVRIEADRGGERRVAVTADAETEVVFDLEEGLDVEGTVTDAAGAPIAGPEVLLVSDALDWPATRVVTHASANGVYRVRSVQPEFSVSARAGGFAPALLQPLGGRTGTVRIDFVLDEEGAGLSAGERPDIRVALREVVTHGRRGTRRGGSTSNSCARDATTSRSSTPSARCSPPGSSSRRASTWTSGGSQARRSVRSWSSSIRARAQA
jgi:RNA polymerase sigma-70 factor (ECF subfamily)